MKFAVVLANGERLPAWQADCIRSLADRPELELALVVEDDSRRRDTSLVYRMVRRFVCRPQAERLVEMPEGGRYRQIDGFALVAADAREYVSARIFLDDTERLDLDFTLDFRPNVSKRDTVISGRLGVWAFHFSKRSGMGDPVLGDLRDGLPTTRIQLDRLDRSTGEWTTLKSGNLLTISHSPESTVDSALMTVSKWPELLCDVVVGGGELAATAVGADADIVDVRTAGLFDALKLLGRVVLGKTRRIQRALLKHNEWNVGIVKSPIDSFLDSNFEPEIEWLPVPEPHCFRADPFVVNTADGHYLFFEHLDYRKGRGEIRSLKLDGEFEGTEVGVDLGADVHLSYPYVFSAGNEIYCVPETSQAGEIALYRPTEFPAKWEKVSTLVSGMQGADASLFIYDNRWWLACTEVDDGANDKLRLWYADDVRGPWEPHRGNPVKIDGGSARPAGTPFWHEGNLYRPAQDSSVSYGGRVVINRIDELTPDSFSEQTVASVGPFEGTEYPHGVHTISAMGDWTVVDARKSAFDSRAFVGAIRRGLTKTFVRSANGKRASRTATRVGRA